MKSPIFKAEQVREWDAFTIVNEPITSLDLMERAACQCFRWIQKRWNNSSSIAILCGPGNNGGDGLVIARLLAEEGYDVTVYLLKFSDLSEDAQTNFDRLDPEIIEVIDPKEATPDFLNCDIYIDALFGTGLTRKIDAPIDKWVHHFNMKEGVKLSIDMPSGVFSDDESQHDTTIRPDFTLTFQCWKNAMMYPGIQSIFGQIEIIEIGLSVDYPLLKKHDKWLVRTNSQLLNSSEWSSDIHKYNRGYLLVVAGSSGMKGARVLVVKGAQSVGVGMIEVIEEEDTHFPIPEAITQIVENNEAPQVKEKVTAVVCGSGLGDRAKTMVNYFEGYDGLTVVFDADALNAIADLKTYNYPKNSILTPHQGELKRLTGAWDNDEDMLHKTISYCKENEVVIVVKGALSKTVTPDGHVYVNTTGNNILATAGSGDFLAGMVGGFASQGDTPFYAAIKAVFYHGRSADLWKNNYPGKFLVASDLTEYVIIDD